MFSIFIIIVFIIKWFVGSHTRRKDRVVDYDAVCCSVSVVKVFRTVASFVSQCIFMTGYALIILTFHPMVSDFSTESTFWSESSMMCHWEGVLDTVGG